MVSDLWMDRVEVYFQQMPHFVQNHSVSVGYFAQRLLDRLWETVGADGICELQNPARTHADILGRYHDIGKTGISDEIWLRTTSLTDDEWKLIRGHTIIGAHMIKHQIWLPGQGPDPADLQNVMAECCLYHHERWDGTGYPFQLKGEQIPFFARVISVAEAFSAMTADRPYHAGVSAAQALKEIRKGAGGQFDPTLAEAFCAACSE